LSSCKLKDFDNMINDLMFPILQNLNLSANYFQSLKGIGNLPKLKTLNISSN